MNDLQIVYLLEGSKIAERIMKEVPKVTEKALADMCISYLMDYSEEQIIFGILGAYVFFHVKTRFPRYS